MVYTEKAVYTEEIARIAEALSSSDRVAVLQIVARNPGISLSDVVVHSRYPVESVQTVRRHLRALEAAGLVRHEIAKNAYVYYPLCTSLRRAADILLSICQTAQEVEERYREVV